MASTDRDRSRIEWAWTARRDEGGGSRRASQDLAARHAIRDVNAPDAIFSGAVGEELMDVVKWLSTRTTETQTKERSYTSALNNIQSDPAGVRRSIAVQCGSTLQQDTTTTQVVEADLHLEGAASGSADGTADTFDREPTAVMSMHSAYSPSCNIPYESYPVFMADARTLGIANRYGYVALPRPPAQLPPRRSVKAVAPVEYPHLFATHDVEIDEPTQQQIERAHRFWTSSSGFVPKY